MSDSSERLPVVRMPIPGESVAAASRQDVARGVEITITPISRRLQDIGQQILESAGLVEVEENILSTCREPIEDLGERLIRARDTGVPLVEVSMFPDDGTFDALAQVFDAQGRLVHSVLRADGKQQNHRLWGNNLPYESLGLSIPGVHQIALDGDYGTEIASVLTSGMYYNYDDSRREDFRARDRKPSFSSSFSYEHDVGCGPLFKEADGGGMHAVLDRILEEFGVAVMADGAIDATMVDEIPEERHIQAG